MKITMATGADGMTAHTTSSRLTQLPVTGTWDGVAAVDEGAPSGGTLGVFGALGEVNDVGVTTRRSKGVAHD
jgi:hypothetical protein